MSRLDSDAHRHNVTSTVTPLALLSEILHLSTLTTTTTSPVWRGGPLKCICVRAWFFHGRACLLWRIVVWG